MKIRTLQSGLAGLGCLLVACSGQSKPSANFDGPLADRTPNPGVELGGSSDTAWDAPPVDAGIVADSTGATADDSAAVDVASPTDGPSEAQSAAQDRDARLDERGNSAADADKPDSVTPVDGATADGAAADGSIRDGATTDGTIVRTQVDAAAPMDVVAGSDGPVGSDGATDVAPRRVIKVPIAAEDLVLDPVRKLLYVSVAGAADNYPNTIVVLAANSGDVLFTIPVGSNPRALALSDDASTLWVGIDGALAIQRLTLTSTPPVVGPLRTLPTSSASIGPPITAGAMVVLPGSQTSVMAILWGSAGRAVAILDDGVARPTVLGFPTTPTQLAPATSSLVFGFDGSNTGFSFFTLTVSASGVAGTAYSDLIAGFQNQIVYQAGHVYARGGEVVDVSNPASPTRAAGMDYQGAIVAAGSNRLVMLGSRSATYNPSRPTQILVLDTNTLQPVASTAFPIDALPSNSISFSVDDLVYTGDDSVAFLGRNLDSQTFAYQTSLFILHDPTLRTASN